MNGFINPPIVSPICPVSENEEHFLDRICGAMKLKNRNTKANIIRIVDIVETV